MAEMPHNTKGTRAVKNNVILQVEEGLGGDLARAAHSVARATAYTHAIRRCANSKKVDKNAKALFLYLVGWEEWTTQPCHKKLETLQADLDMSRSTVQRAIKALKGAGFITVEQGISHEPWMMRVVPCNRFFVSYTALEFDQLAYGGLGVFEENRQVTRDLSQAQNSRQVTGDHKGFNSFNNNTNVLLLKGEQEQLASQLVLAGVDVEQPAPKKGKRPPPTEELRATLESEKTLFRMINAERKAKGLNQRGEFFDTLAQKEEYFRLAQAHGNIAQLEQALKRAFEKNVFSVVDLLPVLRAQANPKRGNGNGHTPQRPAPPPRKIATEAEARAHLEAVKAEREAEARRRNTLSGGVA